MNAHRLLELYDRVSEAPDAIPRLRKFVLDLAVRGKLVEQNSSDEPASDLLKKIELERAEYLKRINKGQTSRRLVVPLQDSPFHVPRSWEWSCLGNVLLKITDGTHHSPPNTQTGDFLYITAKNIKEDGLSLENVTYVAREVHEAIFSRCDPAKGDVLYIKDGATTGIATVNNLDEPFSMLSSVALLKVPAGLSNRLLVTFLRSPFFYEQMRGFMKGAAITRVTLKRMAPALLPIPPLPEQHRIVAKVDELMALCDSLEAEREKRDATRDRLTTASLNRLTAPNVDDEDFKAHADFAIKVLPKLTTRPDQIKVLRQTILDLAVRGKLVEQDPNDEPAPQLLERIWNERELRAKRAKVRLKRVENRTSDSGIHTLPQGWSSEALGNLVEPTSSISYGVLVPGPDLEDGIPFVRAQDLRIKDHPALPNKTIAKEIEAQYARTRLRGGEILLCVVGSIGKVGIAPQSWAGANIARAVARIAPLELMSSEYLVLVLQSTMIQREFSDATRTLAQPTLNIKLIEIVRIPMPPIEEQKRIVAKVHKLMGLCDRLAETLATGEDARSALLQVCLLGGLRLETMEAA